MAYSSLCLGMSRGREGREIKRVTFVECLMSTQRHSHCPGGTWNLVKQTKMESRLHERVCKRGGPRAVVKNMTNVGFKATFSQDRMHNRGSPVLVAPPHVRLPGGMWLEASEKTSSSREGKVAWLRESSKQLRQFSDSIIFRHCPCSVCFTKTENF